MDMLIERFNTMSSICHDIFQGNEEVGEGGGGRVQHMKILSALPPGCVLFVPRFNTQYKKCTIYTIYTMHNTQLYNYTLITQ